MPLKLKLSDVIKDQMGGGHDVLKLENFKDDAAWNASSGDAKLNTLRRIVLILIQHGEEDAEALGGLLRVFNEADGRMEVRRDLYVANGADIIIN